MKILHGIANSKDEVLLSARTILNRFCMFCHLKQIAKICYHITFDIFPAKQFMTSYKKAN